MALSRSWSILLPTTLLGLSLGIAACSSTGNEAPGSSGGSSGTGGSAPTGGSAATGGSATGGSAKTGGTTGTGGSATGGAATGGSGAGGKGTGGSGAGGKGTGGAATGGGAGSTDKFSFFVTSLKAIQAKSGSPDGFGGDLRYGETGQGLGLRGADKICAAIAEDSMPGAGKKTWRAFLSATKGEDGNQVNAIDRIGQGPWYDRLGRLFANSKADLLFDRPQGAHTAIINDFPNEDGVPNHQPDPGQAAVDNHDMLTGTNDKGQLYAATATCLDWTAKSGDKAEGKPRVGHSWPRSFGGMMGGGGRGGSFPGGGSGANWMSSLDESGCAPGINLKEQGGPLPNAVTVGSGGGYGGFYCFALTP